MPMFSVRFFPAVTASSILIRGCALLLGLGCLSVQSQSTTDGAIGGTLVDPSGAAITEARIVATNRTSGVEASTTTDSSGNYRFIGLPPGNYRVEVQIVPYTPYTANSVQVEVGRVTTLSPRLSLGSQQQTVTVKEEAQSVDTTSSGLSNNLDPNAVHNLPSNGRRWSDFALLTPTVTPDQQGNGLLSFRGISVLLNNTTLDGADNNQAFFSEERGRTKIGYSTTEASVREFQVNASNYSAQYGRAAGGVINTVTHSGTNRFHGSSFFYDRDSDWGRTESLHAAHCRADIQRLYLNPVHAARLAQTMGTCGRRPSYAPKAIWFFRLRPV